MILDGDGFMRIYLHNIENCPNIGNLCFNKITFWLVFCGNGLSEAIRLIFLLSVYLYLFGSCYTFYDSTKKPDLAKKVIPIQDESEPVYKCVKIN